MASKALILGAIATAGTLFAVHEIRKKPQDPEVAVTKQTRRAEKDLSKAQSDLSKAEQKALGDYRAEEAKIDALQSKADDLKQQADDAYAAGDAKKGRKLQKKADDAAAKVEREKEKEARDLPLDLEKTLAKPGLEIAKAQGETDAAMLAQRAIDAKKPIVVPPSRGIVGVLGHVANPSSSSTADVPPPAINFAPDPAAVNSTLEAILSMPVALPAPPASVASQTGAGSTHLGSTASSSGKPSGAAHEYEIRSTNTLWALAQPLHMTWEQLYAFKGPDGKTNEERLKEQRPDQQRVHQAKDGKTIVLIYPGEKIWLPGAASDQPKNLGAPVLGTDE